MGNSERHQLVYENAKGFGRPSKATFCLVGQFSGVAPGAKSGLANSALEGAMDAADKHPRLKLWLR